jgi:hypothetical protein
MRNECLYGSAVTDIVGIDYDIIRKDPSLSGGTTITVKTDIDSSLIENKSKDGGMFEGCR